jgi:hypothetical protein
MDKPYEHAQVNNKGKLINNSYLMLFSWHSAKFSEFVRAILALPCEAN